MREVITLHLGQCGNQIAGQFWQKILAENGCYGSVFFREGEQRFLPRAVLVDTEPTAVRSMLGELNLANFFPNQNVILANGSSASNSWANGYQFGSDMSGIGSQVLESVRSELEACDALQGIQITHSLGGGTGSGLGSWLIEALRDELPDTIFMSYAVTNSMISNVVVEPYNSVLSLNTLQEDVDAVFLFDNDSLGRLCRDKQGIESPNCQDFNKLIGDVMAGITCSLRFPVCGGGSLRKLCTNLMPDVRHHLFMSSHFPLLPTKSGTDRSTAKVDAAEIATQIFKPQNYMLTSSNRKSAKILAGAAIFQGSHISTHEMEEATFQIQEKEPYRFADYLTNRIMTSSCCVPSRSSIPLVATGVINSSLVSDSLRRTLDGALSLFDKRAYFNYYDNAISDASYIEQAIEAIESVHQSYAKLECVAPSDSRVRDLRSGKETTRFWNPHRHQDEPSDSVSDVDDATASTVSVTSRSSPLVPPTRAL